MLRSIFHSSIQVSLSKTSMLTVALVSGNLLANIVANTSFKYSAVSSNWKGFLTWQILGNIAGLTSVITLTGLLRFIPLRIAYPLTVGLSVLGIQIISGFYAALWMKCSYRSKLTNCLGTCRSGM